MTGISREIQESVRFKPLANRVPWQHDPWADRPCFVSSRASPTAHYPNRDDPTVLVGKSCGARARREGTIATLRLKTGWHGPFWDDVPLLYMETGLTGPSAVGRKACFHFGSTTQRLALTEAYVDGVFTALNRHSDLLVIVLCFTDTSQVTEESRSIDRFDLLATKYQAFDRRPLRRYVREL